MASLFKRNNIYWISYYVRGKQVRKSLRTTNRKLAIRLKTDIESQITKEEYGLPTGKGISAFLQEYLEYSKNKKAARSYERDRTTIKQFQQFLEKEGISDISEVSNRTLEDFMVWRKERVIPSTINRDINTVLNMFTQAVKWGYINQAPRVTKFRIAETAEYRFLSLREIKTLLQKASGHDLYPIIAVAYYAGLRTSEIINLRWEDIHLSSGYITVKNRKQFTTKSYKNRNIDLSPKLEAILSPIRKDNGLCFPNRQGRKRNLVTLDRQFKKLSHSIGIPCLLKDLRETFGSHLAQKGVSIYKISMWLGHANIEITKRHYAHLLKGRDKEIEL